MKTRLLLPILLVLLSVSQAFATYSVVVSKASYTDLTGATALTYSSVDSGYYFNTGFMFRTFGNHYANFNLQSANPVSAGGFMTNSGLLAVYDSIGKNDVIAFQCFEGFRFSIVPGTTTAAFKIEGSAGNRVLKCQWKNLVYNKNTAQTASFQIWLHEADGSISYHYGPNSLPPAMDVYDGGYSGIVVVKGDGSALLQEINLEGKPSAPVIYRNVLTSGLPTLDTIPSSGTVYTFRYAPNSVPTLEPSASIHIYPNPAGDRIFFRGTLRAGTVVSIYDAIGQLAQRSEIAGQTGIDISLLPRGVYTVEYTSENKRVMDRFIKQQE